MHFESKILDVTLEKKKIHFIPDVVYSQVATLEKPNQLLQMDILQPQLSEKIPVIIFVTGGGFISANRARMLQLRLKLAENNYFVASINYRTIPNSKFPAPIEDVKSAVRFIKANADRFNVDKDKISVIGDSAGGYLTSFVAITNGTRKFDVGDNLDQTSEILSAVDLYGVVDISDIRGFPEMLQSLNVPIEATNPIKYITKKSAPMLIMHGTNDDIVSPRQTDLLFQSLKEYGIETERYLIPKAAHSDDYWIQDEVFNIIISFFDKYSKI